MNKELKNEIIEIQIILYWILSALLCQNHHWYLGGVVLGYSLIVFVDLIRTIWKQIKKENA